MGNFTKRKGKIKFGENGEIWIDFFPKKPLLLEFQKKNDI